MKGYIVNISSITQEDKTFIQLFGRLENQKSFAAVIPFTPYFYLREVDLPKVKSIIKEAVMDKTKLVNKAKESVVKIFTQIKQNWQK